MSWFTISAKATAGSRSERRPEEAIECYVCYVTRSFFAMRVGQIFKLAWEDIHTAPKKILKRLPVKENEVVGLITCMKDQFFFFFPASLFQSDVKLRFKILAFQMHYPPSGQFLYSTIKYYKCARQVCLNRILWTGINDENWNRNLVPWPAIHAEKHHWTEQ